MPELIGIHDGGLESINGHTVRRIIFRINRNEGKPFTLDGYCHPTYHDPIIDNVLHPTYIETSIDRQSLSAQDHNDQ
jgi:hypothetical protein